MRKEPTSAQSSFRGSLGCRPQPTWMAHCERFSVPVLERKTLSLSILEDSLSHRCNAENESAGFSLE